MNIPSLIFWIVFIVPFVALLIWIMRQDKRRGYKGYIGLLVLLVTVVVAIMYMYLMTKGK
ncbi:MAG: hypothetical protein ACOH2A_14035 [Sphingobacteriaceae bacterium]